MSRRYDQFIYWASTLFSTINSSTSKSYYVLGPPKTGTNWMCLLLSTYFDIPILDPRNERYPVLSNRIFHLHRFLPIRKVDNRTIYMIRDGRDVVISYYFEVCRSPFLTDRVSTIIKNKLLYELEEETIRENLPAFIDWWKTTTIASIDYRSHIMKANQLGYKIIKYEDMKIDTIKELSKVLQYFGVDVDLDRMEESVCKNDFSNLLKGAPNNYFLRKGTVGDWRNWFSVEAAEKYDEYAGDMLVELGYERDRNWVKYVSNS